ncbi:MAG: ComEC/Rec2 family competence protein [Thermoleophilaceae bacterium]|nr:ComEC/Rec2 family competence protein [Thermoleophilaceae bacterium]
MAVACSAAGLALATAELAATLAVAAITATGFAALRAPAVGAAGAALVLAGSVLGHARVAAIDAPAATVRAGEHVTLRAHLLTRPRPSTFGATAEIRVVDGKLGGARLLLRIPAWYRLPPRLDIGSEIAVSGRLRAADDPHEDTAAAEPGSNASAGLGESARYPSGAGGPGPTTGPFTARSPAGPTGDSFDFAAYLRRRGIAGELLLDNVRATGRRRSGVDGLLDRMRRRAERAVIAGMPDREGELIRGMVLGQDERVSAAVREDFRDSGLAHLLAVSGQNVMLLAALALPLLAAAGLGPRGRGISLVCLIALYVPLAGAGPSLQRAGVMGAAGIAAMTLSRPASRWYALLLAAAATLALNPRVIGDPGWQLSFAAVAGILTVGAPLQRYLARVADAARISRAGVIPAARSSVAPAGVERAPPAPLSGRETALPLASLVRGLTDGAAITIAATLATAPLLAYHFGSVPLAGLPANLLALPAVAPVMWLGMVKAGLGQVAAVLAPADLIAQLLGPVTRLPVAYVTTLAERFADMPGGQLALPLEGAATVLGAYLVLGGVAAGIATGARRLGPRAEELAAAWRRRPRRQRLGAAAMAVTALALVAVLVISGPDPPDRLTVRFLDVGQGDATLIQHPDGTAVLVDGGPPEAGTARLLRRAGVRRLTLVVATHASRDHHGGLREVLARYPVDLLLDGGDGTRDPGFRALLAAAARRGVRRVRAVAPMTVRAGSVTIAVLSPPPRPPGPPPDDPNPRAVVAVVRAGGLDVLLSADAESDTLLPLDLPDVDAMKVPHHGSADPGLREVLERVRPEFAAIGVGPNTYGHPTASTLAALEQAGVRTYRTDRDGTVTLTVEDGGAAVSTER